MKPIKIINIEQAQQFERYLKYLRNTKKEPIYIWHKKVRYIRVPAMDKNCNIVKGKLLHISDSLPLQDIKEILNNKEKEIFVSDLLPVRKGMLKFPKIEGWTWKEKIDGTA